MEAKEEVIVMRQDLMKQDALAKQRIDELKSQQRVEMEK